MRRFSVLLILSVTISCITQQEDRIVYYNLYNGESKPIGYLVRKISFDGEKRLDSIFRYNKAKDLKNIRVDKFTYLVDGLKTDKNETYLKKIMDSCFVYANDGYKSCYIGDFDISLNDGTEYKNAHKFLFTELGIDGVSSHKYFDKDFILLREEYLNGYTEYFRIDKTDLINDLE